MLSLREMANILGDSPKNRLPDNILDQKPAVVVTDSRQAGPGSLFVCIKGERVDGHDFIAKVMEQGALAVLVSDEAALSANPGVPVLWADDPVKALGALASAYRESYRGLVIGLTGSAGKTSVKEVLAGALAVHGKTAKNFMNLNSQIGLPVSILNADTDADYWVMEAGINEAHDMDELGVILRPDLAIVLNVGAAHLAGLGDRGVAYYKTRLLTHIKSNGKALVSADYPDLARESRQLGLDLQYFSTRKSDADYYASYVGPATSRSEGASGRYLVHMKNGESFEVVAPFRGAYGSENVAAIVGASHLAGLSPQEIISGFAGAALPAQRFSCQTCGSFTMIDDSYNANPLSAARMLETAQEMAEESGGPLLLALGEMRELGDEAEAAHVTLGKQIAKSGAKLLIWKGGSEDALRQGLAEGGFTGEYHKMDSLDEFNAWLKNSSAGLMLDGQGEAKGVILFKASRSIALEHFVEAFRQEFFSKLGCKA